MKNARRDWRASCLLTIVMGKFSENRLIAGQAHFKKQDKQPPEVLFNPQLTLPTERLPFLRGCRVSVLLTNSKISIFLWEYGIIREKRG